MFDIDSSVPFVLMIVGWITLYINQPYLAIALFTSSTTLYGFKMFHKFSSRRKK